MFRQFLLLACFLPVGVAFLRGQNSGTASSVHNRQVRSGGEFVKHLPSRAANSRDSGATGYTQPPLTSLDDPSDENSLLPLQRAAGSIFRGTVMSVQLVRTGRPGEMETVQVTFRVDDAFRGVTSGQWMTIREWVGLWFAGERYRVGEQVLLFLYPPSRLGLTSPVGGHLGRFAVDNQEMVTPHKPGWRSIPVRPLHRLPETLTPEKIHYQ